MVQNLWVCIFRKTFGKVWNYHKLERLTQLYEKLALKCKIWTFFALLNFSFRTFHVHTFHTHPKLFQGGRKRSGGGGLSLVFAVGASLRAIGFTYSFVTFCKNCFSTGFTTQIIDISTGFTTQIIDISSSGNSFRTTAAMGLVVVVMEPRVVKQGVVDVLDTLGAVLVVQVSIHDKNWLHHHFRLCYYVIWEVWGGCDKNLIKLLEIWWSRGFGTFGN